MEKVAVVVPAHNEEKNLPGVAPHLRNWLAEDPNNRVAVVVDDGSTDKTREVAEHWHVPVIASDPAKNRNLGKAQAAREGVIFAEKRGARIVVLLDADIVDLTPEKITGLAGELERSRFDMVLGKQIEPTEDGRKSLLVESVYTGVRAIRMSALMPWVRGKPKWVEVAKGFGLEIALLNIRKIGWSRITFNTDKAFRKGKRKQIRQIKAAQRKIEEREELATKIRVMGVHDPFARSYLSKQKKMHRHLR